MRQGNGALPRLTHRLKGERGQARQDCIQARKRGGGSPKVPPMSATGNGKETMYGMVLHKFGQSRVSILQETVVRVKEAGEEPGKTLIVARKLVQEKSCSGSGLHLPVPPNYGKPG